MRHYLKEGDLISVSLQILMLSSTSAHLVKVPILTLLFSMILIQKVPRITFSI